MTIRDYIKRDLTSRLGSDAGPPADLSLLGLSRHYGVSPTPVREAIRDLVAEGVLLKQGNGRVSSNPGRRGPDKARPPATAPLPPSRSAQLLERLAAEVIGRSLRGETDYLREEATAQRFGVGRTAIRQAFDRLAGRGLLVHVPRCGWRVRAYDEADLAAYLEIREALELTALELARPTLVAADLRRMLAGNAADGRSTRLDNHLHLYLVEKSGNSYIRDFFDRQGAYFTSLFDYAAPETHVVAAMARQHRAILRALLDEDWPRARRALSEHIRAQRPIIQELLRRIGRRDDARGPEDPAR
jgi:DNA-binding GntR family transcriptional regulator